DDGGAVLGIADRDADEGRGVRVDVELDVEDEALAAEGDGDLHPVADPLRAREVRLEGAARRDLVGDDRPARRVPAEPLGPQDLRDEVATEVNVEIALHVLAEVAERAAPPAPRLDHRLEPQEVDSDRKSVV